MSELSDSKDTITSLFKKDSHRKSSEKCKTYRLLRRYPNDTDLFTYDDKRVVISATEENPDGFIEASMIDDHNMILSSAPTPNTMDNFVQMIWEQDIKCIIMLTKLVEDRKIKAHKYWPDEVDPEMDYNEFKLELLESLSENDISGSLIKIISKSDRTFKIFYHMHFTNWPDNYIPNNCSIYLDIMTFIQTYLPKEKILIHCSAGIGRAGVFALIKAALDDVREKKIQKEYATPYFVASKLDYLREHRYGLVCSKEQFLFANKVIREILQLA